MDEEESSKLTKEGLFEFRDEGVADTYHIEFEAEQFVLEQRRVLSWEAKGTGITAQERHGDWARNELEESKRQSQEWKRNGRNKKKAKTNEEVVPTTG